MSNEEQHLLKVRYRNDGDDFHEIWATRRILRLLDPKSNLVAVAMEGISGRDNSKTTKGLLVVDMTEYFGAEDFASADRIIYAQLKHSTTDSNKPWAASEVAEVVEGFAKRFKALRRNHGLAEVTKKIRFQFVTNRPISNNVLMAIEKGKDKKVHELKGHAANAFEIIQKTFGNYQKYLPHFLNLLEFSEGEKGRHGQEDNLSQDIRRFAFGDPHVRLKLKELVHKMTMSDSQRDPTIRIDNLLFAIGSTVEQLFPAPPRFEFDGKPFDREQEPEIASKILRSTVPVLIHATGGVGKSVVATKLPELMPKGSAAVIFDGFAGGEYKRDRVPRHKHRYGLVQIANELAQKGLCDPLLPLNQEESVYLESFRNRLIQAAAEVRVKSLDAVVLIVVDAADNSETAAEDNHERTFIRGLLQEAPPDGCRLVVLSRSERKDKLALPREYIDIPLRPFSLKESSLHLRQNFSECSEDFAQRFHQSTGGNPRVQAYELAEAANVNELFHNLGPNVRTVDDIIARQVQNSLAHIREHSAAPQDIDRMCLALAVLPPMVPIDVLAAAAKVPKEAVFSFVSDLKHPLLIKDNTAVQFRDEPVETWFRSTYDTDTSDYTGLANALKPLSDSNPYVAVILPKVLYRSHRYDELVKLALSNDGPENENVISRRDIVLRRVQYAMKAMLSEGRKKDVLKLSLRAAEEVASKDRQGDFLFKYGPLIAKLSEPEVLVDLIFRKHVDSWRGENLIQKSLILATEPGCEIEAEGAYRLAREWLNDWSRTPQKEREEITDDDIKNYVMTECLLWGVVEAISRLRRWRPKRLFFDVGRLLFKELINLYGDEPLYKFLNLKECPIQLHLAAALELDSIGKFLPLTSAMRVAKALLRSKQLEDVTPRITNSFAVMAIMAVAEALVHEGQKQLATDLLQGYMPTLPLYLGSPYGYEADNRTLTLRAYTLRASLQNVTLDVADLIPEEVKKEKTRHESQKDLETYYAELLPWYQLRAEWIVRILSAEEFTQRYERVSSRRIDEYRYRRTGLYDLRQQVSKVRLSILTLAKNLEDMSVEQIIHSLESSQYQTTIPTWIALARQTARNGYSANITTALAMKAAEQIEQERITASDTASYFAELAVAVLPADRLEAQAFLEKSFGVLDKIDHDASSNLELLFSLARNSGRSGIDEPKEAYRLSRVAELIHSYNDHKFPWHDVAKALAELSPSSAFACIGRWVDRDQGWIGETLPAVTKHLIEKQKLSPGTIIALNILGKHWRFTDVLRTVFQNEKDTRQKQKIIKILERDFAVTGIEETAAKEILSVISSEGISLETIAEICLPVEESVEENSKDLSATAIHEVRRNHEEEIDWPSILGSRTFGTSAEIDAALIEYKKNGKHWNKQEFWKKLRLQVPYEHRVPHVQSIVGSQKLDAFEMVEALKGAKESWGTSYALKGAISDITRSLLNVRAYEIVGRWYSLDSIVKDISELSTLTEAKIFKKLLVQATDAIDGFSTESLLRLVEKCSLSLTPQDNLELLNFSLDRFEKFLSDEDGDGPWHPELEPSGLIPDAIAGMLFSLLASPDSEMRWKVAHVVRRLCHLKQQDIIDALVGCFSDSECIAFTDKRLPFYHMHAQLYSMIAFARAAKEAPEVLIPHAQFFVDCTTGSIPHLLIRHFAQQVALGLEKSCPGTYGEETLHALRKVNQSPYPNVTGERYNSFSDRWDRSDIKGFHFNEDIVNGWFCQLAGAFEGTTKQEIIERSAVWIVDRWQGQDSWAWKDDPRTRFGIFRDDMKTHVGKYSYPSIDRQSFYLTLHAMFCVAGELLAEKPIRIDEYRDNLFDYWFMNHVLTLEDGTWLSDYRDPKPKSLPKYKGGFENNWRWLMSKNFDEALLTSEYGAASITVRGSWQTKNDYSSYEDVSIQSALVPLKTSLALLRALQSCDDPCDYYLPDVGDDELGDHEYKMTGWIGDKEKEKKLDGMDPLSGDAPFPRYELKSSIQRLMNLRRSEDGRSWIYVDAQIAVKSETWGTWNRDDRSCEVDCGRRVVADINFVLRMLEQLKRDLIFKVQVNRHDRSDKGFEDVKKNARIYVLKSDGTLHNLEGSRHIRREAC